MAEELKPREPVYVRLKAPPGIGAVRPQEPTSRLLDRLLADGGPANGSA
jgi:hypothetical protein